MRVTTKAKDRIRALYIAVILMMCFGVVGNVDYADAIAVNGAMKLERVARAVRQRCWRDHNRWHCRYGMAPASART